MINRTREFALIANAEQLTRINDLEKAEGLPDIAAVIDDNLEAGYWRAFSNQKCYLIQNSYCVNFRKNILAEMIINDSYDAEGSRIWIHSVWSARKGLLRYMIQSLIHFAHWNCFQEIVMDNDTFTAIQKVCAELHLDTKQIGNGVVSIPIVGTGDE